MLASKELTGCDGPGNKIVVIMYTLTNQQRYVTDSDAGLQQQSLATIPPTHDEEEYLHYYNYLYLNLIAFILYFKFIFCLISQFYCADVTPSKDTINGGPPDGDDIIVMVSSQDQKTQLARLWRCCLDPE